MKLASAMLAAFVLIATVETCVDGNLEWRRAVRLVMYPSRREAHAGLVKRIERAGGDLIVSRPWLDGR